MTRSSSSSRHEKHRKKHRRHTSRHLHEKRRQIPLRYLDCSHKRVHEHGSRYRSKSRRMCSRGRGRSRSKSRSRSRSSSSSEASCSRSRKRYHRISCRHCRHCRKQNTFKRRKSRSQEARFYSHVQPCQKRHSAKGSHSLHYHCKTCGHLSSARKHYFYDDGSPSNTNCKHDGGESFSNCSKRKRDWHRLNHWCYHPFSWNRHFSPTSSDSRTALKGEDTQGKVRKEGSGPAVAFHCSDQVQTLCVDLVTSGREVNSGRQNKTQTMEQDLADGIGQSGFACGEVPNTVANKGEQTAWKSAHTERIRHSDLSKEHTEGAGPESDWLQLSLKISIASKREVEGVQREDFKLAFPGDPFFHISDQTKILDLNLAMEESEEEKQQTISTHCCTQQPLFPSGPEAVVQSAPTSEYQGMADQGGEQTESSLFAGSSKPQDFPSSLNKEIEVFGRTIVVEGCLSLVEERLLFTSLENDGVHDSSSLPQAVKELLDSDKVKNNESDCLKQKVGKVELVREHPHLSLASRTDIVVLDDSEDEYSNEKLSADSRSSRPLQESMITTKTLDLQNRICRGGKEMSLITSRETLTNSGDGVLIPTTTAVEPEDECSDDMNMWKSLTDTLWQQGNRSKFVASMVNHDGQGAEGTGNLSINFEIADEITQKADVSLLSSQDKRGSDVLTGVCELPLENYEQVQSGHPLPLGHPLQSDELSPNGSGIGGFKSRKKRMSHKVFPSPQQSIRVDEFHASSGVSDGPIAPQKVHSKRIVLAKPRMFDSGIYCDLCRRGPSLSLGEWYAWCCGARLFHCSCSTQIKRKLKSMMMKPKKNHKSRKHENFSWSGKVHRMCALWSSEVFEKDDGGDHLEGLLDAVRRGRSLVCAAVGCREFGATLGCRVKSCRRSFHYPCADKLASQLRCRMWDGVQLPVACQRHRHVAKSCQNAKEKLPPAGKLIVKNWKQKQNFAFGNDSTKEQGMGDQEGSISQAIVDSQELHSLTREAATFLTLQDMHDDVGDKNAGNTSSSWETGIVLHLSSDEDDANKVQKVVFAETCKTVERNCHAAILPKGSGVDYLCKDASDGIALCSEVERSQEDDDTGHCKLQNILISQGKRSCSYLGMNLLCEDISSGREAVMIPCTNDVDADPIPAMEYIIESRCLGKAKVILEQLLLDGNNVAKSCEGCNPIDMDDPDAGISVHVWAKNARRDSDERFDWQGQPMLGRLPYDRYGRLQLGPDTNDVVECNSRCPCGSRCLNRELQKGLQIPLEVFKTKDRGWGVRTMEQIPRGKFIAEFVGEILTAAEADERGANYDMKNFSCLFSADHPEVPLHDLLIVDGYKMSNVARFVNHSCEGNLRIYRVYTEITDLRFCRIGMYAACDIEIGEELCYDYKYSNTIDTTDASGNPGAIRCYCGARTCRQWLWTGGA